MSCETTAERTPTAVVFAALSEVFNNDEPPRRATLLPLAHANRAPSRRRLAFRRFRTFPRSRQRRRRRETRAKCRRSILRRSSRKEPKPPRHPLVLRPRTSPGLRPRHREQPLAPRHPRPRSERHGLHRSRRPTDGPVPGWSRGHRLRHPARGMGVRGRVEDGEVLRPVRISRVRVDRGDDVRVIRAPTPPGPDHRPGLHVDREARRVPRPPRLPRRRRLALRRGEASARYVPGVLDAPGRVGVGHRAAVLPGQRRGVAERAALG